MSAAHRPICQDNNTDQCNDCDHNCHSGTWFLITLHFGVVAVGMQISQRIQTKKNAHKHAHMSSANRVTMPNVRNRKCDIRCVDPCRLHRPSPPSPPLPPPNLLCCQCNTGSISSTYAQIDSERWRGGRSLFLVCGPDIWGTTATITSLHGAEANNASQPASVRSEIETCVCREDLPPTTHIVCVSKRYPADCMLWM